ncbi:MAG: bifunctional methylenetetrahydrofolate dehydrogenase/methenyltetrahydrofolate cyclohydrolase FolD [Myxococcaceae bacterium]|nr:bifunctional methylenetetrahydrofolate dehydrogenase/methenyltetrahydrofolate cyclohydrolase FolD [Myxococcaceae bacterium]MCI0670655.1 bifunctional methylenetetrahydrofolate dehydrogenase/methenyltetrahydrofolate cyclohydrolase FolD [Myxococcaceae bacterium]
MAHLIDGKAVAAKIRAQLKEETARMKEERGDVPGLAVIRVGEDPASKVYVGGKRKAAEEIGFNSWEHHYDAGVSQAEIIAKVQELNANPAVHGMLIQLPLPKHIDADAVMAAVKPEKDADGFHVVNAGLLAIGRPGPRPCTPLGVMRLLKEIRYDPTGKHAVVVGRSNIVGKPMALMLLQANATVTICHSKSDLPREVREADLLVAAVGVPELVKGEWIKQGAVVIDVGVNRQPTGKLVGDVEFATASQRASYITPVPGGVGPMTIAMLMQNAMDAAKRAGR